MIFNLNDYEADGRKFISISMSHSEFCVNSKYLMHPTNVSVFVKS